MGRAHLVLAGALALACAHPPTSARRLSPREPVVLEAVSFESPAEDGWTIVDVAGPSRRIVTLEHLGPDGTWDRRAWVEEWLWKASAITPDHLLAAARERLPAPDASTVVAPGPAEALALDGRFGPLSVSGTVRSEPTPHGEGKAFRGSLHVREWIPPAPRERFVRTGWQERADAGGTATDAPWRDFDASLRSPPPRGASRTAPDVGYRPWLGFAPGAMAASLRGETVVGGGFRVGAVRDGLFPRAGNGRSFTFDWGLFGGENDRWTALVTTLGGTWWWTSGRLRWGAGAEIGGSSLYVPGTESNIFGLVLGARAAAQLDLLRFRSQGGGADVFLEVEGGAAVQSFYRAGAAVGVRYSGWPWL